MVTKSLPLFVSAALAVFAIAFPVSHVRAVPAIMPASPKTGKAVYELLGAIQEQGPRHNERGLIEQFRDHEKVAEGRFEKALRDFCKDEGIKPYFDKHLDRDENVFYRSVPIALALDKYYHRGLLDQSVFAHATHDDLLRFVVGCYVREGDDRNRSAIYMTHDYSKMRIVGWALMRLGCEVQFYGPAHPASIDVYNVLIFTPSPVVRNTLHIKGAPPVLKDLPGNMGKHLKLLDDIGR